jgi:alkyl hydroperoxide reductase subunit F
MLDANLKTQLKTYLEKVSNPIEIVASLDDSAKSQELLALLNDIATLSERVTVTERRGDSERKPSFSISQPGKDTGIRRWGMNSRRWSSRCCRSAAIRSNSTTR